MSDLANTKWRYQHEIEAPLHGLLARDRFPIYSDGGKFSVLAVAETEAKAKLIVRAVNHFDALVAALRDVLSGVADGHLHGGPDRIGRLIDLLNRIDTERT